MNPTNQPFIFISSTLPVPVLPYRLFPSEFAINMDSMTVSTFVLDSFQSLFFR